MAIVMLLAIFALVVALMLRGMEKQGVAVRVPVRIQRQRVRRR